MFFNFLINRILYFTQFGVFFLLFWVGCGLGFGFGLVFVFWGVSLFICLRRSLECARLKFLPILEKADQTFDLFSGNRTNSEVNSKPMVVPEYVVCITLSELIVSFAENRNVL